MLCKEPMQISNIYLHPNIRNEAFHLFRELSKFVEATALRCKIRVTIRKKECVLAKTTKNPTSTETI